MLTRSDLKDVRVIGFDLDQTLYPRSPEVDAKIQQYILERVAAHKGVSFAEAGRLFGERYQGGAGMTGTETLIDLGIPGAQAIIQEALERADLAATLVPNSETIELVRELRRHYEGIDLITGSEYGQAIEKLVALGLGPADFGHLITADRASKSTGEGYRLWLSLYPALSPAQFLYIGDRPRSDHEVPSALGIKTALVYVATPDRALDCLQLPALTHLRSYLL